ncbi:amidohydrolase family protein [Thermosynechococcus sp. PP42]|uniref:amidohydrolase family protein n=1 Tax=Thermosynechococcus sp. PP42 TaxID=3074083 RepID=UPI00285B632A|nr:amidohydrolase family protein [Thermosynechococcus sp. PP42]MDR5637914.1 amidohydrolase family protein [Thermosynechococcus sp. PP42]
MSRIFDFNVHAVSLQYNLHSIHLSETEVTPESVLATLDSYKPSLASATSINLIILNDYFFMTNGIQEFLKSLYNVCPNLASITATTPISKALAFCYLDNLKQFGVKGIKFHCYTQKISESLFTDVVAIAKRASEMGFYICIDTSYGTTKLFDYDNLKLAAQICDFVKNTPVILLHSGGMRFKEALVLADYCPNIYLETSFSLNYLAESLYEDLFAFIYRKLGSERVIFASDFPYVSIENAISVLDRVLDKASFSEEEKQNVFYYNAARITGLEV